VESADVAPTADAVTAFQNAQQPTQQALANWDGIKSQDISRLNASLKQAGLPPISVEGGRSRRNP
jgi:hypothetical protein